jgi:hypothetical protein
MPLWVEIVIGIGVIAIAAFSLAVLGRASALRRADKLERS